jgi:hypothetical protein
MEFQYTLVGKTSSQRVSRRETRDVLRTNRRAFNVRRRTRGRLELFGVITVADGKPFDRLVIEIVRSASVLTVWDTLDSLFSRAVAEVESQGLPPVRLARFESVTIHQTINYAKLFADAVAAVEASEKEAEKQREKRRKEAARRGLVDTAA